MSDKNIAKELFRQYRGSQFQMLRDQKHELYKACHVTKAEEHAWMQELQEEYLQRMLTAETAKEVSALIVAFGATFRDGWGNPDVNMFPRFIEALRARCGLLDSLQQVVAAETVLEIVEAYQKKGIDREVCAKGVAFSRETLNNILANPITVSEPSPLLPRFGSDKEQIVSRAKRALAKCQM